MNEQEQLNKKLINKIKLKLSISLILIIIILALAYQYVETVDPIHP